MKNRLLHSVIGFIMTFVLAAALALPAACNNKTDVQPVYWQNLAKDDQWVQNVRQYLALSYSADENIAAFGRKTSKDFAPAFYSTYHVFNLLTAAGIKIENQSQIVDYLNSTRNQDGAYVDPSKSPHVATADETRQALTVITGLGFTPENIAATTSYLLSLQYDDGTFLENNENPPSAAESTRRSRIVKGTYSVVESLIMLGQADKIPEETKTAVADEITAALDISGASPSLTDNDTWTLITEINFLSVIDSTMVSERSRELISYAFNGMANLPADAFYVTSGVNLLLDTAQLLHMPEANQANILQSVGTYLKQQIFPLQNESGGFGPSGTIEPLTTGQVVILAKRLGLEYPNMEKLLFNVNTHFVDTGWTTFYIETINSSDYQSTYFCIEIAKFCGYDNYDKKKVEQFLAGCFKSSVSGSDAVRLEDEYYAVLALKAMNGKLTQEESNVAQAQCLQLTKGLINVSALAANVQFSFAIPLSKELNFQLPEDVKNVIPQLAGNYRNNLDSDKNMVNGYSLQRLWESTENNGRAITAAEMHIYLNSVYGSDTGAYNVWATSPPTSADQTPAYKLFPDMFQTYSALQLLSDMGEKLPDSEKTVSYILSCKQQYGFSQAPASTVTNLGATFAALMMLKQLSP